MKEAEEWGEMKGVRDYSGAIIYSSKHLMPSIKMFFSDYSILK